MGEFGPSSTEFGRNWLKSSRMSPVLAKFGSVFDSGWPKLDRFVPNLARAGPGAAMLGGTSAKSGGLVSKIKRLWPKLLTSAEFRPKFVDPTKTLVAITRSWTRSTRIRSTSCRTWTNLSECGHVTRARVNTESGRSQTNFGRNERVGRIATKLGRHRAKSKVEVNPNVGRTHATRQPPNQRRRSKQVGVPAGKPARATHWGDRQTTTALVAELLHNASCLGKPGGCQILIGSWTTPPVGPPRRFQPCVRHKQRPNFDGGPSSHFFSARRGGAQS